MSIFGKKNIYDEDGIPTVVERANILPPRSSMNQADDILHQATILASKLRDKYAAVEDRESAYEQLAEAREEAEKAAAEEAEKAAKEKEKDELRSFEVDDFFAHALDRSYGKKD